MSAQPSSATPRSTTAAESQPSVKYCADKVNARYIHGRPESELVPSRYALRVMPSLRHHDRVLADRERCVPRASPSQVGRIRLVTAVLVGKEGRRSKTCPPRARQAKL
jgi:hypothetical protein